MGFAVKEEPLVNGEIIKASRRRMGWSQSELAAKSGVSQSIISRLEAERTPHDCMLSTIIAIASTLMLPLSSLIYETNPAESQDADFPELEPTLLAVVKVLATLKHRQQHQAALILDGFMTALLYDDEDDLRFTDLNVHITLDED